MTKRVIIMTFPEDSVSYQAFSEVKKLHMSGGIKGEQMAVIQNQPEGKAKFQIKDFIDFTGANKASTDSLIGMVIGMFGGPFPMLIGMLAGSMVGAYRDAKEVSDANSVFQHVVSDIDEGRTGVMLIAEENDNRPLNDVIYNQLGGQIFRLELSDVEEEVKAAQAIEKEATQNAQDSWREHHETKGEVGPKDPE